MLLLLAAALPWDLFQRIPFLPVTLTKAAGMALIALVSLTALWRRGLPWRTGLEAPIAVIAAACLFSTAFSLDLPLTLFHLRMYATYLLLFYAVAAVIAWDGRRNTVAAAFIVSCAAVSIYILLTGAGWFVPVLLDTPRHLDIRVTPALRDVMVMRMAPTSNDFNQNALPLLLAFAVSLYLFDYRRRPWHALVPLLLAGGMAVTFSRSSLLVAFALLAARLVWAVRIRRPGWRAWLLVVLVALLIAVATGVFAGDFAAAVAQRMIRGISSRDPSYESRIHSFRAGLHLLPRYWITGTGLAASDAAIARSPFAPDVAGVTVHSVPFKLFLETGILGLIGYGWLWLNTFRMFAQRIRRRGADPREIAYLTGAVAAFLITLIQPFMALSLFPFLLALIAAREAPLTDARVARPRIAWLGAAATLVTVAVVVVNIASYQELCERVGAAGDRLEAGLAAEQRGDWDAAAAEFGRLDELRAPAAHPLYTFAHDVYGLPYLETRAGVPGGRLAQCWPYLRGRVLPPAEAVADLEAAASADPTFSAALFALGDCSWALGDFAGAVARYQEAARSEDLPGNEQHRERMRAADAAIAALAEVPNLDAHLAAARFLIRRGRIDEAEAHCAAVNAVAATADGAFLRGVIAEVREGPGAGGPHFTEALRLLPNHLGAARAQERGKG